MIEKINSLNLETRKILGLWLARFYYYGRAILLISLLFGIAYFACKQICRPEHILGCALIYPAFIYIIPILDAGTEVYDFKEKYNI